MARGDMFLSVEGARTGPIKGEADDAQHKDEIDVLGWSWGLQAQTELSGAGPAGKSSMRELQVRKMVDRASTALMSATRNNELIKRAVLTVRKAGGQPLEHVRITLENGRITSLDVESGGATGAELYERLSLSFQRIAIEYVPQGSDGSAGGSLVFETETL